MQLNQVWELISSIHNPVPVQLRRVITKFILRFLGIAVGEKLEDQLRVQRLPVSNDRAVAAAASSAHVQRTPLVWVLRLGPLRPAGVVAALTLLVISTLGVTAASCRTTANPGGNAAAGGRIAATWLTVVVAGVLRTVASAEVLYIRRRCRSGGRLLLPLLVLVDDLVSVARVWTAAACDTRHCHLAPVHAVQPVEVARLFRTINQSINKINQSITLNQSILTDNR